MNDIEYHRKFWADIAKGLGWYKEPFHVIVWLDERGQIKDSVSYDGLDKDIALY